MQELLPLASYAFISSITPGPNNIMLAASGISFGFKRTLPHMLGIPFGFCVQLVLCSYGLGTVLLHIPEANLALKIFGTLYLIYLAWMLKSNTVTNDSDVDSGRPLSFINAALFQFANPKAWIMAVTGVSVFLPNYGSFLFSVAVLCLVFTAINLPSITVWALLGSAIKTRLGNPIWQRGFSTLIVLLTLYAALSIWLQ